MKLRFVLIIVFGAMLFTACKDKTATADEPSVMIDSVIDGIQDKVMAIIAGKDSLTMIPSLRFAMEGNETYTAKMYGANQITQWIREESMANDKIVGRDYYYENGQLIFLKEEGSVFTETQEKYTEKLIYFNQEAVYKVFEKNQYTEDDMFADTLFTEATIDMANYDLEKPSRALQQKGEFAMYFDQFLLIEPQSYLIVENADKSMNAALYIVKGDSLLDVLYNAPEKYKGQKIWTYHSFQDMNGIERMVYEGAFLLKKND